MYRNMWFVSCDQNTCINTIYITCMDWCIQYKRSSSFRSLYRCIVWRLTPCPVRTVRPDVMPRRVLLILLGILYYVTATCPMVRGRYAWRWRYYGARYCFSDLMRLGYLYVIKEHNNKNKRRKNTIGMYNTVNIHYTIYIYRYKW